jgi:tetratricopeptide (TPR) repeat protein
MFNKTIAIIFTALTVVAGASTARADQPCSSDQGQAYIESGRFDQAIREFSCVIEAQPTGVEGYRGRIEAKVLLGRYSDAVRDYQNVVAFVLPVHPDAKNTIIDGYSARLANSPQDIKALTGLSFARWWFFDYPQAIQVLNQLIVLEPNDVYPNLFRGSSRLLSGATKAKGVADIERAIAIAPANPHVRFIVADAYTYGLHDPNRAFAEASLALAWGLNTPRVHAILGASYNAFGNTAAAADHIRTSIDLVTTELVPTAPMAAGTSLDLDFVPGRVYEIPITVAAGETIAITTGSRDFWDTICVLAGPDGTPVIGSDDDNFYFAKFNYVAPVAGTYKLKVTFFESVITGSLNVTRD